MRIGLSGVSLDTDGCGVFGSHGDENKQPADKLTTVFLIFAHGHTKQGHGGELHSHLSMSPLARTCLRFVAMWETRSGLPRLLSGRSQGEHAVNNQQNDQNRQNQQGGQDANRNRQQEQQAEEERRQQAEQEEQQCGGQMVAGGKWEQHTPHHY